MPPITDVRASREAELGCGPLQLHVYRKGCAQSCLTMYLTSNDHLYGLENMLLIVNNSLVMFRSRLHFHGK